MDKHKYEGTCRSIKGPENCWTCGHSNYCDMWKRKFDEDFNNPYKHIGSPYDNERYSPCSARTFNNSKSVV